MIWWIYGERLLLHNQTESFMNKYKITIKKVEEKIWSLSIKPPSTWSANTASSTDYGATYLDNSETKEEAEQKAKNYLSKLNITDYDIIYE